MTIAELGRALDSKKRQEKLIALEKAANDYILADLIGRSISRIYSSSAHMPDLTEAYPSLFDSEEYERKKEEKRTEASVIRFKQFADTYNKKFKEAKVEK